MQQSGVAAGPAEMQTVQCVEVCCGRRAGTARSGLQVKLTSVFREASLLCRVSLKVTRQQGVWVYKAKSRVAICQVAGREETLKPSASVSCRSQCLE